MYLYKPLSKLVFGCGFIRIKPSSASKTETELDLKWPHRSESPAGTDRCQIFDKSRGNERVDLQDCIIDFLLL